MDSCKFFVRGHCMRGECCRYSHEITLPTSNTARLPPPALCDVKNLSASKPPAASSTKNSSPNPFQSKQPALQNALAFSIKGDPAHPTEDSRSQILCYHHARGNCRNGSACPYSHLGGGIEQVVEATPDPEVRPLKTITVSMLSIVLMHARRIETTTISHESFAAQWSSSNRELMCLKFPSL
jgi:hypothetical protein